MAYNNAAYVWNMGGPGQLKNYIADIQGSGLTTVILFGLHIGRKLDALPAMKVGDLMYNDYAADPAHGILRGNLLVSEGKFNPNNDAAIAAWPAQSPTQETVKRQQGVHLHRRRVAMGL